MLTLIPYSHAPSADESKVKSKSEIDDSQADPTQLEDTAAKSTPDLLKAEPEKSTPNGMGQTTDRALSGRGATDNEALNKTSKPVPDSNDLTVPVEQESTSVAPVTVASASEEKESSSVDVKEDKTFRPPGQPPVKDPEQTSVKEPEHASAKDPEPTPVKQPEQTSREASVKPSAAQDEDLQMANASPDNESAKPKDQAASAPHSAGPVDSATSDTDMAEPPAGESADANKRDLDTASAGNAPDLSASEVDLGPARMSKLAIDSTEKESSPTYAAADVSMTDAPPSVKVVRGREEDDADEPAPKRAKTDPMEDVKATADSTSAQVAPAQVAAGHSTAPTPAPGQEAGGLDETTLTRLSNWQDDETNSRLLTQYQRREIRKVIDRVKKTKSGGHFRDSVQKLWPALWDNYSEKIGKPMDLGELGRNVRDPATSPIATLGEFKTSLSLIFKNALSFNGPGHDITAAASQAVKTVWEDVLLIPAEEPVRPKPVPKPKPVRESRAVANAEPATAQQRPTAEATVVAAAPATATATNSTTAPQEAGGDRRNTSATDVDRPKRTVRAPKPKDIDYTTKPSRKRLKPELQFCEEVLTELMHPKNIDVNTWFLEAVDAEGLNIPTYYSQIKKPMHLAKVHRMLGSGEISSLKEFDKNVRLIFDNCYKFNGPPAEGNAVALSCKRLEDLYVAQMKNKDAWLSRHAAKTKAPAASTSNASDDEDEDDEGDGAEAVDSKELEELQAKLEEETRKLNGMFLGGNQSLIDIQKGIVDVVQNALIKAAQNAQVRAKNKKSGKKAKASGASGGRKSGGGGSQAKKSGSKKAAPKKSLTAAEKDQIATAINDLEGPPLDRAIEVIKQDTGQLVSGRPVTPRQPEPVD